jgi:hypothetical protein
MLSLKTTPRPIKPNIAAVEEQHKLIIAQVTSLPADKDFTAKKLTGIASKQPIEISIIEKKGFPSANETKATTGKTPKKYLIKLLIAI